MNFDGKRVVGVTLIDANNRGPRTIVKCSKEVIISAGSIDSPKILQLSGIGPEKLLKSLNVPLVHANDAVGGNLIDHLVFPI